MQLVEQHIITKEHSFYLECDSLCFKSKNLYNSSLYVIRQAYIHDKVNLIYELYNLMKDSEQYRDLPAKVSASILLIVQKNFKSFFKSLAEFYKNSSKFKGRPHLPRYLDTEKGRFITPFTAQALSKKVFNKSHKIKLSQSEIEFNTKITNFELINCVRIAPKLGYYVIEVVYTVPDKELLQDNKRYAAIDLGVNNLATITSNVKEVTPIIINGRPLKSMNQFYNKELARKTSLLAKRNQTKKSKGTDRLHLKRKNKVDNFLHKSSKYIIEHCKNNNINTLVIGKNDNWKQDVEIGKTNNQNFVNIPHSRFIEMIVYKCELEGINVIIHEESYTSKASFLDLDYIPTYGEEGAEDCMFSGYRHSRGLYKRKGVKGYINADVNGSYNILRKAIPEAFADGIEGIGVCPLVITLK